MKVLFDTNVILDVLLKREPHAEVAIKLLSAVENKIIQGYLCATTLTTIDYLLTKAIGKQLAKEHITSLLSLFLIAEVNGKTLKAALDSDFDDFEDAVLYYSGHNVNIDCVVTRNYEDFIAAQLPIHKPHELWSLVSNSDIK